MIKIILLLVILFILLFLVISRINNFIFLKRLPRFFLVVLLVFVTLIFLFSFRFLYNNGSEGTYVPAKYDGKNLTPGKVEFEKE